MRNQSRRNIGMGVCESRRVEQGRRVKQAAILAAAIALPAFLPSVVRKADAQATYLWNGGTAAGAAWLAPGSWTVSGTPGPAAVYPGSSSIAGAGNSADIANFTNSVGGSSTGVGTVALNLTPGANLNLGAIFVSGTGNLTLGNSNVGTGTATVTLGGAYSANPVGLSTSTIIQTTTNNAVLGNNFAAGGTSLSYVIANPNSIINAGGSSTVNISGVVTGTGTGSLVKNGTGTLTLSNFNTISGGITLNNGTLTANSSSTASGGAVASGPFGTGPLVINGGTLAGNVDTAIKSITINADFTVGTPLNAQRLGLGGPIDLAGGTRNVTVTRTNTFASNLTSTQGLRFNVPGGTATNQITGGTLSILAGPGADRTADKWSAVQLNSGGTPNFAQGSGLSLGANVMLTLSPSGAWSTTTGPLLTLQTGSSFAFATTGQNITVNGLAGGGDIVSIFATANAQSVTVYGSGSNEFSGNIRERTGLPSYVPTGTYLSTVAFTFSGSGLQVLSGSNNYSNTTTISGGGTLRANDGAGLPAGSRLAISSGILEGSGNFTRALSLTDAGSVSITGGVSGFSAAGGPLTVNLGGAGALVNWTNAAGTNFNPSTLVLNGQYANSTVTFANPINLGSSRTIQVTTGTAVMSGTLTNTSTGNQALTKTGAGTLILTADGVTGATNTGHTVSAGRLQFGSNTASGSLVGNFTINNDGNIAFARSDTFTFSGTITSGTASTGALTQAGPGLLIVTGNNTSFTGPVAANASLQVGNGGSTGTLGSGPVTVASGASLIFNRSSTTFSNDIGGSGGVSQTLSTSTITLGGNLAYSGPTTVTAGTLSFGGGLTGVIPAGQITVSPGAALIINHSNDDSLPTLLGGGNLTKAGAGTLGVSNSLAGVNVLTVNAGVVRLDSGSTLPTGNINGAAAGTLALNRSDNFSLNNGGSGLGTVQQTGSGTVSITGAFTAGTYRVEAGTIFIQSNTANGSLGGINQSSTLAPNGPGIIRIQRPGTTTIGTIAGTGTVLVDMTANNIGFNIIGSNPNFTGTLVVNSGNARLGGIGLTAGDAGTANITVNSTGTLTLGRSNTVGVPNNISGAGLLQKDQAGTTVLTGAVTMTGTANISSGQLVLGPTTSLATLSAITIGTNAALDPTLNSGSTYTVSGSQVLALNGLLQGVNSITNNGTVAFTGHATAAYPTASSNPGSIGQNITGGFLTKVSGSSGTLGFTGSANVNSFQFASGNTIFYPGSSLTFTGNGTVNGNAVLDIVDLAGGLNVPLGASLTMSGVIYGTINNSGIVTIGTSVSNTYPANISGTGSLAKGAGNSTGTLTGTLNLSGGVSVTGASKLVIQTPALPGVGSLSVTGAAGAIDINPAAYLSSSTFNKFVTDVSSVTVGSSGQTGVSSLNLAQTNRSGAGAVKGTVLVTSALNIDTASGFLDLGNNDMIVRGGNAATIKGYVAAWNTAVANNATLVGLGASGADAYRTLAVFQNSPDGVNAYYSSFDGQAVDATDVLVKYTWKGDVNLDGILDGYDYKAMQEAVLFGNTLGLATDVNNDGSVTSADYDAFITAFDYYNSLSSPTAYDSSINGPVQTSIPEPAAMGLLVPAVGLLGRRRRVAR